MEFGNGKKSVLLFLLTLLIIVQVSQRAIAHQCDASSSSSEECDCKEYAYLTTVIIKISGECRPKKDNFGIYPPGVQLFVNATQFRPMNPSYTGNI